MPVSNRMRKSMEQGSWIRRMFEEGNELKRQYGADSVFDLSLGNPIMEPPSEFHRELKRLADKPLPGMHRYMENAGYAETRTAVANHIKSETGVNFTANDIVMTCGAAGALNCVLKTILDPGDEVIIFAPFFAEYINYIENHDGTTKIVPTNEQFLPRLDALESAINARTRAVLINSPNNPTGAVYPEKILHQLGELLSQKSAEFGTQIVLINDEPYRKLIYDGMEFPQVWSHYRQTIVVTSHSKDLALPGERIGHIAINPDCDNKKDLLDGFIHCNRILGFVNAPALMQHIVRALQSVTISVADYQRQRDFLYKNLTGMGYSVFKPQGAFYMFPKSPIEDDVAFVRELVKSRVLTVPGRGFGTPGYFRLSFCVSDKTLEGSLKGFREVAKKFKLS